MHETHGKNLQKLFTEEEEIEEEIIAKPVKKRKVTRRKKIKETLPVHGPRVKPLPKTEEEFLE